MLYFLINKRCDEFLISHYYSDSKNLSDDDDDDDENSKNEGSEMEN